VQEAADPDCNIIFGSVIDANMGDEVRITVIATGFQTRETAAAHTPVSAPSRPVRRGENQMALPMQPVSYGSLPAARAPQPQPVIQAPADSDYGEMTVEPYPLQPYPPVAAVSYPPPVAPMPLAPSAQMNGAPGYGAPATEQWAPAPEGRPIIRPPVTSATSAQATGNNRRTPIIPAALAAEDLGIEESEFDKPAYLRRGLHAHDPSTSR
jgi:cell division protein FtsZ